MTADVTQDCQLFFGFDAFDHHGEVQCLGQASVVWAMARSPRFQWPVVRGKEKGWVERAIRYVRDSFFVARTYTDLADLNAQADDRLCPQDRTQSVQEAFAQEQPRLLALPANPWPLEDRVEVAVGKTPYARFDLNDYSMPHALVRRTLTVLATPERVRILDGQAVVADHHAVTTGARKSRTRRMSRHWSNARPRRMPSEG